MAILNKGLKYILNLKHRNWISTLTLEAETIINQLSPSEQDPIRFQVTKSTQNYTHNSTNTNITTTHVFIEKNMIYQIKKKLNINNVIVVKADKVNSLVITPVDSYVLDGCIIYRLLLVLTQ